MLWSCQEKYKWVIMNLQKNVRLPMVKLFALFVKKKRSLIWGFYKLAKKLFFEFQKVWNHITFFFLFHFQEFSLKLRKKKHKFHFQIAKIFIFVHQKKSFWRFYSRQSTFTKLAWNCHEFHGSFTETDLKLKKRPEFHWNWVPKIWRFWHEIT